LAANQVPGEDVIVGILSDTHDRAAAMSAAVELLRGRGAKYFIHCGDVGSEHILDYLAGLPAAFVWGNNDWDRLELQRYAQTLGITCYGTFGEFELEGKRFALMHGDDFKLKHRVLAEQRHDYLLQGHTHVASDTRVCRVRCINPGALHRTRQKTVALLDTASDELALIPIQSD
jgi:hypothetical protein